MTGKNKHDVMVEHHRSKQMEANLIKRGVDYANLLSSKAGFDLADSLVKIEPDIPRVIVRPLTVKRQYDIAINRLDNPLKGRYILGISSFPSDARAKHMAVMIMRNAISLIQRKNIKLDYPLWHKVYGNYKDELRDRPNLSISMLILSNITSDSTSTKLEKVRDLLERYSDIPRIVVLSGTDPITFFANRLYSPLTASLYLGPDNRIREV